MPETIQQVTLVINGMQVQIPDRFGGLDLKIVEVCDLTLYGKHGYVAVFRDDAKFRVASWGTELGAWLLSEELTAVQAHVKYNHTVQVVAAHTRQLVNV